MICYTYDTLGNYTGKHTHVKHQPLPERYTTEKPPKGDYPVWVGKWELRDEPVKPVVSTPSKEQQEAARNSAYMVESDPLFFQWQAGESSKKEWLDAREAVRAKYPYP